VPTRPSVLGALRLRRWAWALLGGTPTPPPTVPDPSWRLFLAREACASRLRQAAGDLAPEPLRKAAERETQLILLLRAELQELAQVANEVGVHPVVLKGGAALHDPARAVGAKDIDLLLPTSQAEILLSALDQRGWRRVGESTGLHFGERIREGRPPVEIHPLEAIPLDQGVLDQTTPHPLFPGLRLLASVDQAHHVAIHQVHQHPSHRGRLRDLLLLADALKAAPPASAGADQATPEVIAMAEAIRDRRPTADRFEELAAVWYSMDDGYQGNGGALRANFAKWVHDHVAGAAHDRWTLAWGTRLEDGRSDLLRRTARALWLPPVVAAAWVRAQVERRKARAALAELDGAVQRGA